MPNNPYRNRGAIVEPAEFVGRNEILCECLDLITGGESPQNISIYGDKWSGKTWLLRTIQERLREHTHSAPEHLCIYLDVQGIGTPRTFYGRLNRELAAASRGATVSVDDSPATLTELVKRTSEMLRTVVVTGRVRLDHSESELSCGFLQLSAQPAGDRRLTLRLAAQLDETAA